MIEVEAKIKISNPEKFRALASSLGKLVEKGEKIDNYYTLEFKGCYPKKSLRVRKKNKHYEINFKQKLSYIKGIHAKDEQEFQVTDIKNFLNLIADFGFRKWLTKIKKSEVYKLKDNFNMEINHVKDLGWFLELEILTSKNKVKQARKEILDFMENKLKIKKSAVIKDGYTKLLWNKRR